MTNKQIEDAIIELNNSIIRLEKNRLEVIKFAIKQLKSYNELINSCNNSIEIGYSLLKNNS